MFLKICRFLKDGETALDLARRRNQPKIVEKLETCAAQRSALLDSPDLIDIVWASIINAEPTVTPPQSISSSAAASGGGGSSVPSSLATMTSPPPPFQGCPWPRFVSYFLPAAAKASLLERIQEAHRDFEGCLFFFCSHVGRRMTRWSGLWPIRNTIREFLVYPQPTRRMLKMMETLLNQEEDDDESSGESEND